MEGIIQKIRILAIISLSIVLIESVIGVGTLFSGLMYRSLESDKAKLKLEIIRLTNKDYYDRITGDEDSLAKADYYSQFQRHRKPILISGGYILLALAFFSAIPPILMILLTMQKKAAGEESDEEEKTGEGEKEES